MVLVTFGREGSRFDVDAEGRAEHRCFDVVSSERVTGQKDVDVAGVDELDDVLDRASVDDGRAANEDDRQAACSCFLHGPRDLGDQGALGFFGRDGGGHELEDTTSTDRTLERLDAHAIVTDDDLVASANLTEAYRSRLTFIADDHTAVHAGAFDGYPTTAETHRGWEVGGDVETLWEDAVPIGRFEADIGVVEDLGAVNADIGEDA